MKKKPERKFTPAQIVEKESSKNFLQVREEAVNKILMRNAREQIEEFAAAGDPQAIVYKLAESYGDVLDDPYCRQEITDRVDAKVQAGQGHYDDYSTYENATKEIINELEVKRPQKSPDQLQDEAEEAERRNAIAEMQRGRMSYLADPGEEE